MAKSIQKVNWQKLRTPHGSAATIPKLVREMSSSNPSADTGEACGVLREKLVGQNAWSAASGPAVALCLDSRKSSEHPEKHLWVVADILAGDCARAWIEGIGNTADSGPDYQACVNEVVARLDDLLRDLNSERPCIRAGVAAVLGAVSPVDQDLVEVLARAFDQESNESVRATLLCSLEMLDLTGRWRERVRELAHEGDESKLVWGIAGLCWLRRSSLNGASEVLSALEALLGYGDECREVLIWQNVITGFHCGALVSVLKRRAGDVRQDDLRALTLIGQKTRSPVTIGNVGSVLSSLFGRPPPDCDQVIPARELSTEMRQVAERLAKSWIYPLGGWMPAIGSVRGRWLGVDPPSVLEVPVRLDDSSDAHPLWELLRDLESGQSRTQVLPERIASLLTPLDRWRAAMEFRLGAYGMVSSCEWKALSDLAQEIEVDDDVAAVIITTADELCARGLASNIAVIADRTACRLLLLPLVRSGRRIPERLHCLICVASEPEDREVLASLPSNTVSELLLEELRTPSIAARDRATVVLDLIDLAPEQRVCEELVRVVGEIPQDDRDSDWLRLFEEKRQTIGGLRQSELGEQC